MEEQGFLVVKLEYADRLGALGEKALKEHNLDGAIAYMQALKMLTEDIVKRNELLGEDNE